VREFRTNAPSAPPRAVHPAPEHPLRGALVGAARRALATVLRPLPGYAVLEAVGAWPPLTAPGAAVHLGAAGGGGAAVRVRPWALPIASGCAGALVITHLLDECSRASPVLAEAERVLAPGGQLVIVGMNPWSLCGLREWAAARGGQPRLAAHLHGPGALRGELRALGLRAEALRTVFHGPPIGRGTPRADLLERVGVRLLPRVGGVYVLAARKERVGVRPLRLAPARELAPAGRRLGLAVRAQAP
jgi:SAM-dependent methyltransferase